MSERQTVQRWMITVGGVEQARVGAGQSVEIGRKPIRPLREDGFKRVDIVDNKRSMSKRHALLIVDNRGVATIRDLHSTNGTYLVGANGDLLRLEPDVDFQLPDSLMRMQFGDVPVDFVRVEEEAPDSDQKNEVRNLFSYATDDLHDEPAASGLSVDQILDLRAGEPTGIFHAQSVAHPGLSWQQGEQKSPLDNISPVNHDVTFPVVQEQQEQPVEPRNLFDDAKALQAEDHVKEEVESDVLNSDPIKTESNNTNYDFASTNTNVESVSSVSNESDVNNASSISNIGTIDNGVSNSISSDIVSSVDTSASNVSSVSSISNIGSIDTSIDTSIDEPYTPAFEPGSVFEKVSKGEFDAQQQIIEIDGYTSQEAKESNDFSRQFEMAQYPELLPYLAANTGLYDDLYAWLAAQGNAEVDSALARNSGYSAYRKAIEQ